MSELPSALPDTVPGCHELIHQLMQRLSLLEERVNLNSRNVTIQPPCPHNRPPLICS